MSQVLGEVDDIFNEQGDIVVTDEETDMPTTPPPRGEAGDGPSQQRQPQRRRGLEPGTKRGPYKRVAPDARKRILDCTGLEEIGSSPLPQMVSRCEPHTGI